LSAASIVILLAAFGIGWVFSGVVLNPIQRITQTARAIGEERDFTRRVDYTGPQDEVGQLATMFNSMLGRLQDAYQRVAHSLQMECNFVAAVSHELRTPLTTLRGNLGLLRRDPPIPTDEQADILNDIVDVSDRLIRLVNDLLVFVRVDAGRGSRRSGLRSTR
jgi:signal transduction histidine kinase